MQDWRHGVVETQAAYLFSSAKKTAGCLSFPSCIIFIHLIIINRYCMRNMLISFSLLLSLSLRAQEKYMYSVDLKNINGDKVNMELLTPSVKEQEIIFSFPRVIPGSYSEKSFGKYIDDFKVFDKDNKLLKIKKINQNQYLIKDASTMRKITYKVNDTWDTPDKDFIFQPGGSNIESGKNVIMNNHAFYGYLEGYNKLPFEIKVSKPSGMYASTHLQVERKNAEEDILLAKNYVYLADNPVFYCSPDTTSFAVGNSRINISVYSASGKVSSSQVSGYLKPMALALQQFFNGLPVDSYQFLFYFEDPEKALIGKEKNGGGYGALEHNYSSLYFLPEMAYEPQLKSMVNEVSSHEFLHILTPLNLHSEYIEYFDFINPKMSKHLWLYEGVTEYFANLVQVQSGLITEKKFFQNMRDKINEAEEFGDFSMTTMSEKVLEESYQKKYSSVYNRGALIGLMLDILIREKTNNEKDLKKVIVALSKKYGAGKPFKDDEFLAEFVQFSHPDVQDFIDKYITGDLPLPFAQYFNTLGYDYSELKKINVYFFGKLGLKYDEANKAFAFTDVEKKNALGIEEGDFLISVDNIAVTDQNLDDIWENYFQRNSSKPELMITIKRKGQEKILSGPLYKGYLESKNYLDPFESPSALQIANKNRLIRN
jgi:predicted metalloprotease with PDZ domain